MDRVGSCSDDGGVSISDGSGGKSARPLIANDHISLRYWGSVNHNHIRRDSQESSAELLSVGIGLDLLIEIILDTNLLLTGHQAKQVPNKVDHHIGTGIFPVDAFLLVCDSSSHKVEQSKAQNER
jgi:hypothetical protein